ncbi:MAG: hypothetical protein IJG84_02435 [Kiritimatiellae bacterium]|nr:hypothetical protein [Kiritimatiellia bacterium]
MNTMQNLERITVWCAAAAAALISNASFANSSDTVLVRQDPSASLLWKTVTAPSMEVMLDWPDGASRAVLSVDGEVRATVYDATVASTNISFALPSTPAGERMVTLSVSYLDGTDAVVGSDEAKLGLVCGTDGVSSIPVRVADSGAWHKAGAASAVLPVLDGATSLSIGDTTVPVSPTPPDWYWWRSIGASATPIALALESGETCANTVRGIAGMSIVFR